MATRGEEIAAKFIGQLGHLFSTDQAGEALKSMSQAHLAELIDAPRRRKRRRKEEKREG